jgi:hypothetical protein
MLKDFSRQRVAVDVKQLRRLALISIGPRQRNLDKSRFKIFHSVFQADSVLQHFLNESFQVIFHSVIITRERVKIFLRLTTLACRSALHILQGLNS